MKDKNITPAVGVLIFRGEEVLLVQHGESSENETGIYGLPAGRIQEGESEVDAAVRELFEETGLRASPKDLFPLPHAYVGELRRKHGTEWLSYRVFLGTMYSGTLKQTNETAPLWVLMSEIPKLWLLPNVAAIIAEGVAVRRE